MLHNKWGSARFYILDLLVIHNAPWLDILVTGVTLTKHERPIQSSFLGREPG